MYIGENEKKLREKLFKIITRKKVVFTLQFVIVTKVLIT